MASMIDEHPAFFDDDGKPLVDGEIFIGVVNADPETPITIYSDRSFAIPIDNPQTINSFGRSTNKIWIPGEYSMEVKDSAGNQIYQELDNGAEPVTGAIEIENILGTNTITGQGVVMPITTYSDNEIFIFQAFAANTGAVTLNWDSVGAKALVYDSQLPLEQNHIQANQTIEVAYNLANDNFVWLIPNRTVVYGNEGADIASGSTVELGDATGNVLGITGNTTITSFGTTPAGSRFWLEFLGAAQITHNGTSLIIPAQANYTTSAGDIILVTSLGSGNNSIQIFPVTGFFPATQAEQETATSTSVFVSPARQQFHPSASKAWVKYTQDTPNIDASYNITSVADDAPGQYTVTIGTDFSSTEYVGHGSCLNVSGSRGNLQGNSQLAGTMSFITSTLGAVAGDSTNWLSFYGDQ